jgi:hypothetical protein
LEPRWLGAASRLWGRRRPLDANAQSANYQAAVAKNNQILAGRYADLSTERGNIQSELSNYKTRQALGTARAGFAAQGWM